MIAPVTLANAIADAVGLDDLIPPFMPGRVWQYMQGRDPDAIQATRPEGRVDELPTMPGGFTSEGEVVIDAAPVQVWQALLDPERLRAIIPGCESVEATGPDSYRARVRISVAGIGASYDVLMRLFERREPERMRLSGRAESRRASVRARQSSRSLHCPRGARRLPIVTSPRSGASLPASVNACSTGSCECCSRASSTGSAHMWAERRAASSRGHGDGPPCCGGWSVEDDTATMKPVSFSYLRPDSANDACRALARHGEEARVIAGGQSLGAMLNMRLVAPAVLIDVNRLDMRYHR